MSTASRQALQAVLDRTREIAAAGELPIAVFDLDSTLFNTAARHLQILNDFARKTPAIAPLVSDITLEEFGWSVSGPLRKRGFHDTEVIESLHRFWFERFFTDAYVLHDEPAKGGPAFVQDFWNRGGLAYYLTGRDVHGMGAGTAKALITAGYPYFCGRALLHLKPTFEEDDKRFKDRAIAQIRSYRGVVVATFENEPGNANLFLRAFPQAQHFLHGTVCAPDGDAPDEAVIRIDDFHC
jgi:hypothetical protein